MPDHMHAWIELQFVKNKFVKSVKYKSIENMPGTV